MKPAPQAKSKTDLLKTTGEVFGTSRPNRCRRETWWWSEEVEGAIVAKIQALNVWQAGKGTKEAYCTAKRTARRTVHHACKDADNAVYENIGPQVLRNISPFQPDEERMLTSWATRQLKMVQERKQKAWLEHYKRLLNVEFEWDPEHSSDEPPLEGPPIPITIDMV